MNLGGFPRSLAAAASAAASSNDLPKTPSHTFEQIEIVLDCIRNPDLWDLEKLSEAIPPHAEYRISFRAL